jgi:hypothetical protein
MWCDPLYLGAGIWIGLAVLLGLYVHHTEIMERRLYWLVFSHSPLLLAGLLLYILRRHLKSSKEEEP